MKCCVLQKETKLNTGCHKLNAYYRPFIWSKRFICFLSSICRHLISRINKNTRCGYNVVYYILPIFDSPQESRKTLQKQKIFIYKINKNISAGPKKFQWKYITIINAVNHLLFAITVFRFTSAKLVHDN